MLLTLSIYKLILQNFSGITIIIKTVIFSLSRGEKGRKTLSSTRVTARGSLDTEGVDKITLDSTYYWHPVKIINCFHCT